MALHIAEYLKKKARHFKSEKCYVWLITQVSFIVMFLGKEDIVN